MKCFTAFLAPFLGAAVLMLCIPDAAWAGGRHGHHRGRHHGHHGHGHHYGGHYYALGYWALHSGYRHYRPYVRERIVVEPAPVYIERDAAPGSATSGSWYYCASSQAYYPEVETCNESWIPVPPRD